MQNRTISYSFLVADLFHYGHMKILALAKEKADYHICGVASDKAIKNWLNPVICSENERYDVIASSAYVDECIFQNSLNPLENLKKIHQDNPDARIVYIKSHYKWEGTSAIEFVKSIGGEVITPEYYPGLSRNIIANKFYDSVSSSDHRKGVNTGNKISKRFSFSTKANTLMYVSDLLEKAVIEDIYVFNVKEWQTEKKQILNHILKRFNGDIVVRSSSLSEDQEDKSNAGYYESVLNVNSAIEKEIFDAVTKVIKSYEVKGDFNDLNQVLVQKQSNNIVSSGVLFTRNIETNTPYYLINYDDSDTTDTVTSGLSGKRVEISRKIGLDLVPPKWKKLIEAVKEIEELFENLVLDIEFGINKDNEVIIFQIRPLAANSKLGVGDDQSIFLAIDQAKSQMHDIQETISDNPQSVHFSDMAFWNPSELIGDRPHALDASLFNHILMKSKWNDGLVGMGYTEIRKPLMQLFCGKPYINLNYAFETLIPKSIKGTLREKLLRFYNDKLIKSPELHDKVEFDIVYSCYDFGFEKRAYELRSVLSENEIQELKRTLIHLTNNLLKNFGKERKKVDNDVEELSRKFDSINSAHKDSIYDKIDNIKSLIDDCKDMGAGQFSTAARYAFIGKSLLNSLVKIKLLNEEDIINFFHTIESVAVEFDRDLKKMRSGLLAKDDFLKIYGHLRPGTYNLLLDTYRGCPEYIQQIGEYSFDEKSFEKVKELSRDKMETINRLLTKEGINIGAIELFSFIRESLALREQIKFIYTKNISKALDLVAEIGTELGISKEDMVYLDYYSIVNVSEFEHPDEITDKWKLLIKGRREQRKIETCISLPPLLFSPTDMEVVSFFSTTPNFITDKALSAEVVVIKEQIKDFDVEGKIVEIENADPGYDWLFSKSIAGLITKYGGVASHMAIRCAEFGIPAVIGCGNQLYDFISQSSKVKMDCKSKKIDKLI